MHIHSYFKKTGYKGPAHGHATMINRVVVLGLLLVLISANFAEAQQQRQQQQQTSTRQQPPSSRTTRRRQQPSRGDSSAAPAAAAAVSPVSSTSLACFVRNCAVCNTRNSYVCAQCRPGYALTNGVACSSCSPGYQQNLDAQSFTCTACPAGTTSNGGTGPGSQCRPITPTSGRRLFEFEEDLWA